MAKIGYEVLSDQLNIRAEPNAKSELLETVDKGAVLHAPDWVQIKMDTGEPGYVNSKYVRPVEVKEEPGPVIKGVTGKMIVAKAMTQAGDPYVFGYEVDLKDPNPDAFDCSELVQWVCAQLKVSPAMPDGAANQRDHCQKYKTMITVAQAVKTAGALLFRIQANGSNHVVISRGDGSTIEAKGSAYGVGVFQLTSSNFNYAAKIPGVTYEI